jgi:hypothetical protein
MVTVVLQQVRPLPIAKARARSGEFHFVQRMQAAQQRQELKGATCFV